MTSELEATQMYVATNSPNEIAEFIVDLNKTIAGLTKNNADFAKKYRALSASNAKLREALEKIAHGFVPDEGQEKLCIDEIQAVAEVALK